MLLFVGFFRFFNDGGEGGGIDDGKVCEDFAVEVDVGSLQAFDEAGVGHSGVADGSGNPLDPEATELAFALFAVTVFVLPCFVDSIFRVTKELGTEAAEAFGA